MDLGLLGSLTAVVVAAVIVTMVVVRQNQSDPKAPEVRARRTRRIRPLPVPRGLPPLSSVPAPDADQSATGDKDSK